MCGLFGFYIYGENEKDYSRLLNELARATAERGTHATGIAYNYGDRLRIYKRPLPAEKMNFKHLDGVKAIMGHTRHATQGKASDNINNHPFFGYANRTKFASCHNGIIYNDTELKKSELLPHSKIETDSYILNQLIEKKNSLELSELARITEKLQGYYTFTMLDQKNNLYIIKGDSPIEIYNFKKKKILIYASTYEILKKALKNSNINIKQGEKISIKDNTIYKITQAGEVITEKFKPAETRCEWFNWWQYDKPKNKNKKEDNSYYNDLVSVARYYGYDKQEIDELLEMGFTLEEIEEYIYTGEVDECF